MAEIEEKLESILSNPQMMQTIFSMAQSLGQDASASANSGVQTIPELPDIDFSLLQKLGGMAGQTKINPQQQALLQALIPFLSQSRIGKLERAMRAAQIARFASVFFNSGGMQLLSGR